MAEPPVAGPDLEGWSPCIEALGAHRFSKDKHFSSGPRGHTLGMVWLVVVAVGND